MKNKASIVGGYFYPPTPVEADLALGEGLTQTWLTGTMTTTPKPIDIRAAFEGLDFLPDRVPTTSETDARWAAELSTYRDGGMFIVHYAGQSEWERHSAGDEIVMVIDGSTTITLIIDGEDQQLELSARQLVVVPQGTWHRFDTPNGVKVMTVTPQPTDHQIDRPTN